jgi:hypothetical protein
MHQSVSPSIEAARRGDTRPPRLVLIGRRGPAWPCPNCNGFEAVTVQAAHGPVQVLCDCRLVVAA